MPGADRMGYDELVRTYSDALSGGQVGDRTPPRSETVWAGPGSPARQRVITKDAAMGLVDASSGAMSPPEGNHKK